jgi:hypothetical protein
MLTDDRVEYRDYRQRIFGGAVFIAIVKFAAFSFYVQGPIAPTKAELLTLLSSWHGIERVVVYINDLDEKVFNMIE